MKITFLLNSMTEQTIEKNLADIRWYLENENNLLWFVNHIIIRRATNESENQANYINLIEKINKKPLQKLIVKKSLMLLSKVLYSNVPPNANEKNIIKNLGGWVG